MFRSRARLLAGTAAGLVALVAVVGVALAAKPKADYTFNSQGSSSSASMFFRTSSNRNKLVQFDPGFAIKCGHDVGGFGGVGVSVPKTVKVSKKGTFKVSGKLIGVGPHPKKLGKETVTGKFVSSTEATGKVTTVNNERNKGKADECWGTTRSFKAFGTPTTTLTTT